MRSKLTYDVPSREHIEHVAGAMRECDRQEVLASHGLRPLPACDCSVRASSVAATALWDGEPVAVFGVVPVNTIDGVGSPWLLGTDRLNRCARELLTDGPQLLLLMQDGYSLLRNYVDARNVRSRRWLQHIGFTVHPPEPFGVSGLAFHLFERRV